jgi:aminopeptidase N
MATDVVKPEWGMRDQFQFHISTIMQIDSVASSHKLIADVSSSTQVTGLFDDISYGKVILNLKSYIFELILKYFEGASIVRLLLYILGDSTFEKGLRV